MRLIDGILTLSESSTVNNLLYGKVKLSFKGNIEIGYFSGNTKIKKWSDKYFL